MDSGSTPVRPPFDPDVVEALEVLRGISPELSSESLPFIREAMANNFGLERVDLSAGGRVDVLSKIAPGEDDAPDVDLLMLRSPSAVGPLPLIYFVHGGGMVTGNRTSGVEVLLPYVRDGLAVVASVEYRLAPEHQYPAPLDDCYAGLVWLFRNAAELAIDPARIVLVGVSAGGGLAAGCALMARDRGVPILSHQILMSPMLDDRLETHSSRMLDREGFWDRHDNLFGWTTLLGERRGGADVPGYAG